MAGLNVMDVITKGTNMYDTPETVTEPVSCRSSTSHSTRTESQLSLEYLPPEAPYYGGVEISPHSLEDDTVSLDSDHEEEMPQTGGATDQLYQRIQALSDQIHSELDTMVDMESVSSHQPTPVPSDAHSARESLQVQELSPLRSSLLTPEKTDTSNSPHNECRDLICVSDSEKDAESKTSDAPAPRLGPDFSSVPSDPKLKKAFDKMKKLDEKLADLEKKEKEVKRQRKLLEQQMESENLSTTSAHSLDREMYSPVFTTQLNENSSIGGDSGCPSNKGKQKESAKDGRVKTDAKENEERKANSKIQAEITGTNFIKRNIELASDAGALVAMTEAEKSRLEQLVGGEEQTEGEPDDNPLSVIVVQDPQEGFGLNQENSDRIKMIESELLAIPPPSDWESILCSSRIDTDQHSNEEELVELTANDRSDAECGDASHSGRLAVSGEEMSQDEQERLRSMLFSLSYAMQEENQLLPQPLPQSDLQTLLEQCHQCENTQLQVRATTDSEQVEGHSDTSS